MADERDRTSSTELVTPSSSSPTSSSVDANENQFKANPEEKFRVRLAAEAYDGDSAMKYREYSTDDEEEPVNRKHHITVFKCIFMGLDPPTGAETWPWV